MDPYGIQLRQPSPEDLIGHSVAIAAIGTAFEASYGWRLVHDGTNAAGSFQTGSMGSLESLVHEAEVHTDHIGRPSSSCPGTTPLGNGRRAWTPRRCPSSASPGCGATWRTKGPADTSTPSPVSQYIGDHEL